jgi:hypothetical protein
MVILRFERDVERSSEVRSNTPNKPELSGGVGPLAFHASMHGSAKPFLEPVWINPSDEIELESPERAIS